MKHCVISLSFDEFLFNVKFSFTDSVKFSSITGGTGSTFTVTLEGMVISVVLDNVKLSLRLLWIKSLFFFISSTNSLISFFNNLDFLSLPSDSSFVSVVCEFSIFNAALK